MLPKLLLTTWGYAALGACAKCLEEAQVLPNGWKQVNDAPDPSSSLRLSIAIRQPEIHGLKSKMVAKRSLASITHLSLSDILSLRSPDQQDVDDVMKWLADNDITDTTADKDWVHVRTTVGKAEPMLQMKMHEYSFNGKPAVLRAREYSIPDTLSETIGFIHPIINFMAPTHDVIMNPAPKVVRSAPKDDFPCQSVTTPDCIRELYNVTYKSPDNKSPVRLAVAGFLEEHINYDEVHGFLRDMAPSIASSRYNFSVELVNGGQNPQKLTDATTEASLDMDYVMSLGFPSQVTFYSTGGRGVKLNDSGKPFDEKFSDNEPYLEFLEYLLDMPDDKLPHVLSVSYSDDETSVPKPYAEKVCSMLGLLTSRGMSIFAGSGDGGARGARNSTCHTNDGSDRDITMSTFPPTCPWVTAVGATDNTASPPKGADFSTGGFSQYFPREDWQESAIDGYVKTIGDHLQGTYNPKMRATPDISAIGTQFVVRAAGSSITVGGTSASTPVIASLIALVNDARLRSGKKSIGWLNELLYSDKVRSVLRDVTEGESVPCEFKGGHPDGGWPAEKGFDAITGLGVPGDFGKLMQVLVDA